MGKFNADRAKIRQCIEQLAMSRNIRSFYPEYICKLLGIEMKQVIQELQLLVEDGCLDLKYEIRSNEEVNIVKRVEDYNQVLGKTLEDNLSGEIFEVEMQNIFPCYYINKEYREYLKKKYMKQKFL